MTSYSLSSVVPFRMNQGWNQDCTSGVCCEILFEFSSYSINLQRFRRPRNWQRISIKNIRLTQNIEEQLLWRKSWTRKYYKSGQWEFSRYQIRKERKGSWEFSGKFATRARTWSNVVGQAGRQRPLWNTYLQAQQLRAELGELQPPTHWGEHRLPLTGHSLASGWKTSQTITRNVKQVILICDMFHILFVFCTSYNHALGRVTPKTFLDFF